MQENLKTCPFCGSRAVFKTNEDANYSETVKVTCTGCAVETPYYTQPFGENINEHFEDAIEHWNKRK